MSVGVPSNHGTCSRVWHPAWYRWCRLRTHLPHFIGRWDRHFYFGLAHTISSPWLASCDKGMLLGHLNQNIDKTIDHSYGYIFVCRNLYELWNKMLLQGQQYNRFMKKKKNMNFIWLHINIYNSGYSIEIVNEQCNTGDPLVTSGGLYRGPSSMLIYVNAIQSCACETLKLVQSSIPMNVKLLQ